MTERTIFMTALEIADSAERAAYIEKACAGDAELQRQVAGLLAAHEREGNFLDQPAVAQFRDSSAGNHTHDTHHVSASGGSGANNVAFSVAGGTGESLDFLAPSNKAGALGRLGHYEVLEVVGRGGMGVVLRAFDEKLHRVVAIKVLAPHLASSDTARHRFVREARAAAAVNHDNVIAIHAVEDTGPVPYLVMHFVSGQTLQEKVDRTGPPPLKEILRIGMQTAEGLGAAHKQGLIHRDVKPANVLLENGVERVRITDFGLARAADDVGLTQTGAIAGTPQYMSPEQAEGKPIDQRSDLFSLGSVLYAICTGNTPFQATSAIAVLKRVCEETPRPIREVNPAIPEWLEAIIARLHAKDPARRYQTAKEVAEILGQHLANIQQATQITVPKPVNPLAGLRLQRKWVAGAAVIVVAVIGLSVAAMLGSRDRTAVVSEGGDPKGTETNKPMTPEQLARMSSPFDGRKREDIQQELLALAGGGDATQAPLELVAVLRQMTPVLAIAVSPDSRLLASGSDDRTIRLWDLTTRTQVHAFQKHKLDINSLAFSPDGKFLASGGLDATIILWDLAQRKELRTLTGHSAKTSLIAYSPDGSTVAAGSEDGRIKLWDAATGNVKAALQGHTGPVRAVAFSPDGKRLASVGADKMVRVVDAASGQLLQAFALGEGGQQVAFTPDGSTLAATCTSPNAVYLWDLESRKEQVFLGHTGTINGLALQPGNGLVATGASDGTIRFWDRRSGSKRTLTFGVGSRVIRQVAFTPEGRYLAAASENGTISIVRVPPPPTSSPTPIKLPDPVELAKRPASADALDAKKIPLELLPENAPPELVGVLGDRRLQHRGQVLGLRFIDNDQTIVSVGRDSTVRFWETATGQQRRAVKINTTSVSGFAISPDASILALGYDVSGSVFLWDLNTGKEIRHLRNAADRGVLSPGIAFSADGKKLATGGRWWWFKVWDVATGNEIWKLTHPGVNLYAFAFSPDGKQVVSVNEDAQVYLWDNETGQLSKKLEGHKKSIDSVAYSPDGSKLATGGWDGPIKLWDVAEGKELHTLNGHAGVVRTLQFSPDGKTLVSGGGDKTIRFWEVTTGKERYTIQGHSDRVEGVAFTADGKTLASASEDGTVKLWDVGTGVERLPGQGHKGKIASIAVSPDGRTVASAGEDRTIKLWDVTGANPVRTLRGHSAALQAVAFSPDGKWLASQGLDGKLLLWDPVSGKERHIATDTPTESGSVCFSPDSRWLACATATGTIQLWDVASGKVQSRLSGHSGKSVHLAFSPDTRFLVSVGTDGVRLWDISGGWQVKEFAGVGQGYGSVAFSPDGQLVALGSNEQTIELRNLFTGVERFRMPTMAKGLSSLVFRADGRVLAYLEPDGVVRLRTVGGGEDQEKTVTPAANLRGQCIAFTPEGRYLAIANTEGTISILSLAKPGEVFLGTGR